jgi:two-component system NtrC family sensor kinase
VGRQEGIERVRIFNKEGKITFSSDKKEINSLVDKQAEACYVCHTMEKPLEKVSSSETSRIFMAKEGYRVLGMIAPVYNEPDCYTAPCHAHKQEQKVLGVLDITFSLALVDRWITHYRNEMLVLTAIAILGISAFLGLFVQRFVNKPVNQLLEGTLKVAEGDLDFTIPMNSTDEIGILARSFNQMTGKLKEAHTEIQKWVHTLEEKVAERTNELTELNKELEKKVAERTEELQNACSQIVAIEKMVSLGKISAMVAHELNNPMSGILSYSKYCERIVKEGLINGDRIGDLGECLEMISREAERCGNIVNNLLIFSKKSYGEFTQSNLSQIMERSLRVIEHSLKVHEIVLEKEFGAGDDLIWCDPSGLEQMFIALIINAVEAMEKGGKIRIQIDCSRKQDITIQISDTGRGIPAEILPRIFEPFFSSKNSKGSAGLGLSVVYGIVQSHNGDITVKSKVGEGTAFTILLPRTPSEKPNVEASLRQELYSKRI